MSGDVLLLSGVGARLRLGPQLPPDYRSVSEHVLQRLVQQAQHLTCLIRIATVALQLGHVGRLFHSHRFGTPDQPVCFWEMLLLNVQGSPMR